VNIFIADITGTTARLREDESYHCTKVLRNKTGDTIGVIDGLGNFYKAVLNRVHEKACEASITEGPISQTPRDYYLHLAIAPTKQIDRIEWMVEKCVELGIDEISFFTSVNSERTVIKVDRIRKIVESAVKQSLQARIPKVNELMTFESLMTNSEADVKLIAHCGEGERQDIRSIDFAGKKALILIGPEGDFSPKEVVRAQTDGFRPMALGATRLRTETAGLFVCAAVKVTTEGKR
jgi:16S rRNA (uracil1498-N3)-methyltransferase